jgi:D-alanyl-D-alanine carboxypeptidase
VKSSRGNKSSGAFDASRTYRRRRRLLLAAVVLVLVLAAGYVLLGMIFPSPPSVATGETAAVEKVSSPPEAKKGAGENDEKRELKSLPLPEPAESCDDLRVLVDQNHPLPPDYVPRDLVSLSAYGIPLLEGEAFLRREAADQLGRLMSAAAADGEDLIVASAYRSFADQQASYGHWTEFYGQGAGGMSAPPGQSQHQLGTAVDFTNAATNYEVHQNFGFTSGNTWLKENAAKYGYVLAYPKGQEEKTGYNWEPWHYRYVGKQHVARMQASGMNLNDYLVKENVLPRC